jgi:carbamoylphosphate synthase large subunit
MKIMLSFSYRASLISQNDGHILQAMVPIEAHYLEDIAKLDHCFPTDFSQRITDLISVIENPEHRPDVLIMTATRDDLCQEEAIWIEEIHKKGIKVIGHSLSICELCRDKKQTKEFLQTIGVPVPREYKLSEIHEDNLPIALKHTDLWEGKGVSIISEINGIPPNLPSDIMAEQYIQGVEMSVQVIRYGNKTIVSPPVYKGTTSHQMIHPLKKTRIFPNPWHAETLNPIVMKTALKIAEELKVEGPIDIDLVATSEEEIYILEINSRLSGVSRMICSAGHNVMDMLISMAVGTWNSYQLPKHGVSMEIPVYCERNVLLQYQESELFDYIYFRNDVETNLPRNRILVSGANYLSTMKQLESLKEELQISETDWSELVGLLR